MQATPILLGAT